MALTPYPSPQRERGAAPLPAPRPGEFGLRVLYHELCLVVCPELAAIADLARDLVFVQPLVQMQPFEDELDGGGDGGGAAVAVELGHRRLQAADPRELIDVFNGRLRVRRLHAQALLEAGHQLLELRHLEIVAEDFADGLAHQLLDDLLLARLADSIQLDLAGGGGDDRREVADARHCLPLLQADGAPHGVAVDVLEVGDGDTHAHAGLLADVRAAPRLMGDLGDHLFHELRAGALDALGLEGDALRLHDLDLMLDVARIVRANLRAEPVFEWRDDAPAVGVLFRVGASDDEDI